MIALRKFELFEAAASLLYPPVCTLCGGKTRAGEYLCGHCAGLDDERLREHEFDMIVPVPLHPTRQRERGFNQASLLAELLRARMSIPCKPMLKRVRYTTTQTALDRAERMENLHNAFRL